MNILYIFSSKSEQDKSAWSGTVFRSLHALRQAGHQVTFLSALQNFKETFLDKLLVTYWLRVPAKLGKSTRMDEAFYSVRLFKQTLRNFDYSPYDIIFVPTHIAIINALPKKLKPKLVHLVDATVDSLFNYYSEFSNLLYHNYLEAHILGKRAFRRADLIIASSHWCKQNAITQYGINPAKIEVVEFGANLNPEDIPATPKQLDGKNLLKIYWSGVNWTRKGGDIALQTCDHLISLGFNVQFHITGLRQLPPEAHGRDFIFNHGFLNKNHPDQYRKLISVMSQMDIFLFPSRAECSSIALCEANGFALPCFVYDTGGTANYVQNGVNGFMLPLSAIPADFANTIAGCIRRRQLSLLSQGAATTYTRKLNWSAWSHQVNTLLTRL